MIWLTSALLLVGLCATIPATPDRLPAVLLGFYWILGWLGQSFALPLLITSLLLAGTASGVSECVAAVAALLYAVAHWRNRRAGRQMLGAAGLTTLRIPFFAGVWPFATGGALVLRIKDIAYGPAGERNMLDLLCPTSAPASPMPVVIHIHGGAWVAGAKGQQGRPLLHYMARQGWICLDINYRLGPVHHVTDMIEDIFRAIAWARSNVADYGGDPARIALTGGSAGGHLAALAALSHDDASFKPGFETADCSVMAAVPLYGRYDFLDRQRRLAGNHQAVIEKFMAVRIMPGSPTTCPELWHAVSPLDRLRQDAPPLFVVHGSGDTMLPCGDAKDFAASLAGVSAAPVTYVELPGIQHAWDICSSALTWAHVRCVAAFLQPLSTARKGTFKGNAA